MLTRKRNKKTYLDKILQQLSDEPLEWNDMVSNIKSNWNEETTFNEEFIIKSIIKGIISYFDSNNFEPINKKIKDDEFLKNTIYFFLINKNIPSWSDYKMLGIDDVISFIKIKIKNSDSKYIKELLLDNKIAPTIISKLKNENISIQLEVLKTLEASSEKSFSIANFFEKINKFSEYSNFETTLIFEYIIKNNLWEKPSLIYVFNEIYPILKKNNLHKKTNIIKKYLLSKKKNVICRIKKNVYHCDIALSKVSVHLETKSGVFSNKTNKLSKFPNSNLIIKKLLKAIR